ncbi:zinc finger protein 592 [Engraulis encrasicolus]|uniref:zinc finger protein 592 n=1 Tax=Engraulis encrasicolus TaxID=184585 RepID=UPI002FD634FC
MGDMKTPDFDDLLAAFDIPDATGLDAKEAIPEGHDDAESHLKHTGMCMDDGVPLPHSACASDIPAVSVIVKNTSRQESYESALEKESPHFGNLLQNGFRTTAGEALDTHHIGHSSFAKIDSPSTNGEFSKGLLDKVSAQYKAERLTSFAKSLPQFSPISSPELEEVQTNGVMEAGPKQADGGFYPAGSFFARSDGPVLDHQPRKQPHSLTDRDPLNETVNVLKKTDAKPDAVEDGKFDYSTQDVQKSGPVRNVADPTMPDREQQSSISEKNKHSVSSDTNTTLSRVKSVKASTTSKLSSCLEALEALNARKDSNEVSSSSRETSTPLSETMKVSPKVPISPRSPRSPLEVVKQRLAKQPDSPMSICSDSSGKASPALAASSGSPAIPRVRIKTIKTSSGQIKRTVTSVVPDSEAEDLNSSVEWSPAPSSIEESSSKTTPVHRSPDVPVCDISLENDKSSSPKAPPPTAAAAASVAAARPMKVKSVGRSKKLHGAGGNARRAAQGQKQKKGSAGQAGSASTPTTTTTGFLPKALHLANLNLVPHSVAASVTARSSTHRQQQGPSQQLSSSVVCSGVPLVHQVKKVPTNSRTVTSNTAAMTLNRLLNYSNPIPTYVPNLSPPPECSIGLPPQGYSCAECGDSFSLQKSLAGHYGRKSVHIEVTCTHCNKTLVFFNKCALLAHARGHRNRGIVMQCTQLFMKPLPADQMFTPSPAPTTLPPSTIESSLLPAASSQSPAAAASSPAQPAKSQAVMPLYQDKVVRHGLKCLECDKQMSDYKALAGHYQRLAEDNEGLMCKVCTMPLPNKCSFKAHQRIHTHKSPYVCPECGALSRSADIQKHVKENCLHYCRKAGYKCIHCELLYVSFNVLKKHIEEKHCNVFYKCSSCPVAFKTYDGCVTHIRSKHADNTLSPQIIYKCCCETVFKKKQLLFQHFSQRAKKLTTCVFKCPECTALFMQKQLLVQHFKDTHGGVYRGEAARSTKETETSLQQPEASTTTGGVVGVQPPRIPQPTDRTARRDSPAGGSSKTTSGGGGSGSSSAVSRKKAGWTCGECLVWLPDRDTYVAHMKTSHGKSVKRHPCRDCDRSFNSPLSLRRHIRNDHDGKKKVFTCWYCTEEKPTFTKHSMLKNHISLMHGIKNPDFSQMAKVAPPGMSRPPREAVKRSAAQMQASGRRVAEDTPADDGGSGGGSSSAKRPKAQFRCSKCGFAADDQGSFLEHIPQHKTHPDTPQCQHCGLCFTSPLALSRHLFIVHKVKEKEKEEEEGEGDNKREEEEVKEKNVRNHKQESQVKEAEVEVEDGTVRATLTSPSDGDAPPAPVLQEPARLQCNTCSETFTEDSSYRLHLRNHETNGVLSAGAVDKER